MNYGVFGKQVFWGDCLRAGGFLVTNGKISEIFQTREDMPSDIQILDAHDLAVLPGIVDAHVHINEPGRTDWEGFETATLAAAAGGTTTLIDMPLNSIPVTITNDFHKEKISATYKKLSVDLGFWGGAVPSSIADLDGLLRGGVLGVKVFLTHSGIDEFPNVDEAALRKILPIMARYNRPLLVHAELESCIGNSERDRCGSKDSKDRKKYRNFLKSRPDQWEVDAIRMMIRLAKEFNCPVHIVHLSSCHALEDLRQAKEQGVPITAETCPHYLSFYSEEISDGSTEFKCAPPIRNKDNREKLWQALKDGVIDFIASDHSPCIYELKKKEEGDFVAAWGGISSLQFLGSIIFKEAEKRNIKNEQIIKWLSTIPAEFAGLKYKKGKIAEGYDADFVFWDLQKKWIVKRDEILFKNKFTPYMNQELLGWVHQTYVRGELVYDRQNNVDIKPKIGDIILLKNGYNI